MPLKRLIFPNANSTSTLEDLAWLEWRPDTDRLLLSAAAIRMLQIDASLIPETQFSLMQLFEKNSRNKLAITFEDIVNSGKQQSI
jgi:hypothetical protein